MSEQQRKPRRMAAVIALAVGAAFLIGGAGGAVAAKKIQTKDLANGAVTMPKLDKKVKAKINKKAQKGPKGAKGADGADGVGLGGSFISETPTVIDNIGGSFASKSTLVGTFHLDAGQYLISSDGFFDSEVDVPAGTATHLQLAIRGDDGSAWGADYGTCFTGAAASGDREATCATSRLVTIPEGGQDVNVIAFGYNENTSSQNGGVFNVLANVTALSVLS